MKHPMPKSLSPRHGLWRDMPIAAVCMLVGSCAQAAEVKTVFSSYTEESTSGWAHVSEKLATQLVVDSDTQQYADQCIRDDARAKDYHQFLVAKTIPLSADNAPFTFVRPAHRPYCQAFYGAHIYALWVLDRRQQVVFATSADAFAVLDTSHKGMRDLVVSQCRGGYCYNSTFVFETRGYAQTSCETTTQQTKASVPGCPN